jgi:hypothetical protein
MTGPRFDDLDVYDTPADLPASGCRNGWLEDLEGISWTA